jgi:hypothetical protein
VEGGGRKEILRSVECGEVECEGEMRMAHGLWIASLAMTMAKECAGYGLCNKKWRGL